MFKPVLPEQSITVVSPSDPSIDIETSDLDGYAEVSLSNPGSWRDYFKFKEGQEPTEFEIGVIPPSKLTQIEHECKFGSQDFEEGKLRWQCFLSSIRDIRKFDDSPLPKKTINGVDYVDPEYLSKHFGKHMRKVASHIGALAYYWNHLSEEELKNL